MNDFLDTLWYESFDPKYFSDITKDLNGLTSNTSLDP